MTLHVLQKLFCPSRDNPDVRYQAFKAKSERLTLNPNPNPNPSALPHPTGDEGGDAAGGHGDAAVQRLHAQGLDTRAGAHAATPD